MNYRFPILTVGGLSLLAVLFGPGIEFGHDRLVRGRGFDQPANASDAASGNQKPVEDDLRIADVDLPGNRLIRRAAERVFQHTALSARSRLKVWLFGEEVHGTGKYHQFGPNDGKQVRFDMTISMGKELARFQQVSNGRFLWLLREIPSADPLFLPRRSLRQVDLDQVRKRLAVDGKSELNESVQPLVIGIPKVLDQLQRWFEFSRPVSDQLKDRPVWFVRGEWKRDKLAGLTEAPPAGSALAPAALVDPLPDGVEVTIDQHDLFPYRIEFFRHSAADGIAMLTTADSERRRGLAVFEFFEVEIGAAIDPLMFDFRPGQLPFHDSTDEFLLQIGRD